MIGILTGNITFIAGDGSHSATVEKTQERQWDVNVSIRDVNHPVKTDCAYLINTGTPHLVNLVDNLLEIDIKTDGPRLRHDIRFMPEGVNVNWFSMTPGLISVRTYEKGVEDETLSCGTGVTACALVAGMLTLDKEWKVETKGGNLRVTFDIKEDKFTDIILGGPADLVFIGETNLL
jgi:diaminopimelate epimerase